MKLTAFRGATYDDSAKLHFKKMWMVKEGNGSVFDRLENEDVLINIVIINNYITSD